MERKKDGVVSGDVAKQTTHPFTTTGVRDGLFRREVDSEILVEQRRDIGVLFCAPGSAAELLDAGVALAGIVHGGQEALCQVSHRRTLAVSVSTSRSETQRGMVKENTPQS